MARWNWRNRMIDKEQLRRLELLESVSLLDGLSQKQLGKLLVKLFEKEYAPDEVIFRQNEPGKALFIVFAGSVLIVRTSHHGEEELATITPGGYFGELALLDDQPRSATARTAEGAVLLILYKSDFDDLIEGQRIIAIHVMGNLLKALAGYVRNNRHTNDAPVTFEGSLAPRKRLG